MLRVRRSPRSRLAAVTALALVATMLALPGAASASGGGLLAGAERFAYNNVEGSPALAVSASDPWCVDVPGDLVNPWDAAIGFNHFPVEDGAPYTLTFTAWADPAGSVVRANVGIDEDPWPSLAQEDIALDDEPSGYQLQFTGDRDHARGQVAFQVGGSPTPWQLCVQDVVLTSAENLIVNGSFEDGAEGWWSNIDLGGATLDDHVEDGALCVPVPAGGDPWSFIVGQDGVPIVDGQTYTYRFTASGDPSGLARVLIQLDSEEANWPTEIDDNVVLVPDGDSFEYVFTASNDWPDAQVAFQLGGATQPWTFCLSEVSLIEGGEDTGYTPDTGPRVRVNQVGYLPEGPKSATLVTDELDPVDWSLLDDSGAEVGSGQTTPRGPDPSAGDINVHTIDFSHLTVSGEGFTLAADGEVSFQFDISASLYDQLRKDSLGIYYSQRSGIEIDDAIKPGYGRPAGHLGSPLDEPDRHPDAVDGPNQGDYDVPCLPNEPAGGQLGGFAHYGADGWDCPEGYRLDLTGGWYDAGDHGKYVVNSGISVYQLLSTYERNQLAGVADRDALGDGTLAIPETGNGVPDILDEVRWNLEWMLKMQVPAGTEMGIEGASIDAGGLVHHKLHDIAWTGIPLFPHNDPQPRYVHRPSTAATLNLAAAAAHGARLYDEFDEAFAQELLDAARVAWDAAVEHPEILAPDTNVLDPNPGGGPYNDTDVSDEFYWAAAQLYLTTGEDEYLDAVLASPHHEDDTDVWRRNGFDWGNTAAAGRLDLAVVPSELPDRDRVVQSVLDGAEFFLGIQAGEPFGHPYAPDGYFYDWGSAHQVINNAVVIATAYDLSGEQRFLDGAIEAIDYILGRNALNNSYVTGYGTVFSQNMHSRWYAAQANPAFPHPPDGKLAGGPNSGIQDPLASNLLAGCVGQFCYIDHIQSWSTNETTINWNAALAWHASWLADMGDGAPFWRHPTHVSPTSKDECRDGGWERFSGHEFRNQGECVSYVAKQHRPEPPGKPAPPVKPGPALPAWSAAAVAAVVHSLVQHLLRWFAR